MKTVLAIDAQFDAMIARYGWAVQCVFGEGDSPPFAYTVGLTALGHPELLVFGLPQEIAHRFLNQLGTRLRDGAALPLDTDLHDVVEGMAAQLVAAPRSVADQYMFAAKRRYPDYRPLQLIWPDKAGCFPWDHGFDPQLKPYQPVLRNQLN